MFSDKQFKLPQDTTIKLLTAGYIHKFKEERKEREIIFPTEINAICIDYFYQPLFDRFSNITDDAQKYTISQDGCNAILTGKQWLPSLFGEKVIEPLNNDTIYSWTFRIIKMKMYIGIGIASRFESHFDYYPGNYALNLTNGTLACDGEGLGYETSCQAVNPNDILKMVFDVGKGHISYIVNEKPIETESKYNRSKAKGVAFDTIRKANNYRMAVCVYAKGE